MARPDELHAKEGNSKTRGKRTNSPRKRRERERERERAFLEDRFKEIKQLEREIDTNKLYGERVGVGETV